MHCLILNITHTSSSLLTKFVNVCHRSANTLFELEWRDGRVCVRAANGKYVIAKKNGQLAATVDNAGQCCLCTKVGKVPKYNAFVRRPGFSKASPSLDNLSNLSGL